MLGRPARSNLPSRGLWRIVDDRIIAIDRTWSGPTTVLVPSEDVLTLAVDLPFATRRQREMALPFAIEDAVAEPLAALHCALGQEIAPRRHLAGVVQHSRMRGWLAILATADLDPAVILPDALSLSMPVTGAWSVRVDSGRALVRTDQGTGFALPVRDLPTAWSAAGQPRLALLGGDLPDTMIAGVEDASVLLGSVSEPVVVLAPLDLRQGAYAPVRAGAPDALKSVAMIAGIGLLAHVGILAADAFALHRMAETREAEARALLLQVAPNLAPGEDLIAAADRALPQGGGGAKPFTRLMAEASGALPSAGQIAFTQVDYSEAGDLSLGVNVPDAATLDRAVAALNTAGLTASGEPAGAEQGVATSGLSAAIRIGAAQ
ncbi:type II secretion system protein GspL [Brevundimonas variabilis]|uniref:General secretion pathway protein L n=1 Tax=Brevundimonas variabilis TaxID=74312 RepID=A0A7W9CKN3_9CAUL|nr:type II secretion system protein GspL [Brevundimonas variabilis]MBB5747183.1 general secretion pathway protein L [Brevundimonas variabilis]